MNYNENELSSLIKIGLRYRIDDNNEFIKIDKNFLKLIEGDNYDKVKKWYFIFFNNLNEINDKKYNEELKNLLDKINNHIKNNIFIESFAKERQEYLIERNQFDEYSMIDEDIVYNDHDYDYKEKLENLIEYLLDKKFYSNKTELKDKEKYYKLIDLKKKHINNNFIKNKLNLYNNKFSKKNIPYFFKKYDVLKEIIDNLYSSVKTIYNEKFYDFFENDNNFEIYFTINDLVSIDISILKKILHILSFNKYEKIIYVDEDKNLEMLDENPFNIYGKNILSKRVIKYYNTFKFDLYESVDNWLNNQTISKKFKKNKNLKNFLKILISYINLNNVLFNFEDKINNNSDNDKIDDDSDSDEIDINNNLKKIKIILNIFNKNKFLIIDEKKIEINGNDKINIYKDTINKINDYINYEINDEELKFKERNIIKNINDFKKYILPEVIQYKNNIDLNLLMYFINNPKNNENIILGLINKYKDI